MIAADGRSGQFLSESTHRAGQVMLRSQMTADTVLPVQGTIIVDRAERLSLKETVLLQEKALSTGAQLIFMDTENRQGTGNALSVLKEADIPQYRFYSTTLPEVLAGLTAGQREATQTVLENTDRFMAIQGGETPDFRNVLFLTDESSMVGGRYRQSGPRPQNRQPGMVAVVPSGLTVALRCGYHRPRRSYCCAVELDDRSHQAPKRQRRDLLLEEILKQVGIPLLCGDNDQLLAERVREHLCARRPEGTA